ncbi:hypothetical protein QJ48_05400 [Paenibacillus sp. A3]|nr:hypothetical protein QJ48_05400 [Paenibacillus sp. A3]
MSIFISHTSCNQVPLPDGLICSTPLGRAIAFLLVKLHNLIILVLILIINLIFDWRTKRIIFPAGLRRGCGRKFTSFLISIKVKKKEDSRFRKTMPDGKRVP